MRFPEVHFRDVAMAALLVLASSLALAQDDPDAACRECHGSPQQVRDAAEALEVTLAPGRDERLAVASAGPVHDALTCVGCHPQAEEIPHPAGMLQGNPCATCHEDSLKEVNASVHADPAGGEALAAPCWGCHTAHDVRPMKDPGSPLAPSHVAERCLTCHDKQEYLAGVHGHGVQMAGLDVAATCVSCHGGHDILDHEKAGSRVARRNISYTCGTCHTRVAETYRASAHGAPLTEEDNPDVPTCVDCHQAHATADPRSPEFRVQSPRVCGSCHADATLMAKYDISTEVFETYVADFHGTTAELFRSVSPEQPFNQAVCFDCHGYHDVQSAKGVGQDEINRRLLQRCQACHPGASFSFLSAWTGHYVPTPDRYPLIYWVRTFYWAVIPGTVGFFLLYIAIDWRARRRQRRSA